MSFLGAVDVNAGINVGLVLDRVLHEIWMTHKEAALTCGMSEGKLSEGIDGVKPLDLWRLRHLPMRFWQAFLPALAAELIKQWMVDRCRPYRMLKCELREERKEKIS